MVKAKSFALSFLKKEKIAKDTYTFYFNRGKFPKFIPGQYIHIEVPHKADDRGTTRYFTISSSPLNKKYLTITTRIIKSSFKKSLLKLKPGTKVNIFGPIGWFLLPKDTYVEKVFIAGGIGVTPFHSLLHTLKDQKLKKSITLFVSFSKKENAIFYNELMEIAKNNAQIKVFYLFSKISKEKILTHVSNLGKSVFYIVGSESMVASTKKLLLELGIEEEKIQTEDFTGY